jgi:hypothetical protein
MKQNEMLKSYERIRRKKILDCKETLTYFLMKLITKQDLNIKKYESIQIGDNIRDSINNGKHEQAIDDLLKQITKMTFTKEEIKEIKEESMELIKQLTTN